MYELAKLKLCRIAGLVDNNLAKQNNTVGGVSIQSPEILRDASPEACVVLTSVLHGDAMAEWLVSIGFSGEVIRIR